MVENVRLMDVKMHILFIIVVIVKHLTVIIFHRNVRILIIKFNGIEYIVKYQDALKDINNTTVKFVPIKIVIILLQIVGLVWFFIMEQKKIGHKIF